MDTGSFPELMSKISEEIITPGNSTDSQEMMRLGRQALKGLSL